MKTILDTSRYFFALALLLTVGSVALADADDDRRTLEAELAEIMNEILESTEGDTDPFEDGGRPDLVILSSANVVGEVAPCG